MSRNTRVVHASYKGMLIVRYDRSGKWYLEPTDTSLRRQVVSIGEAVEAALWGVEHAEGSIFQGRPGGTAFDRKVNLSVTQ